MSEHPIWLIPEQRRHGVTIYAECVAALMRPVAPSVQIVRGDAPASARVHVQFTDKLWGDSPEEASARFEAFAAGRTVTVTLHDVPQDSDGAARYSRRVACYRTVVSAAAGIACSSAHEATLIRDHLRPSSSPTVIELPLLPAVARPQSAQRASVGVLGYFYPGKGHAEVLTAMVAAGLAGAVSLEILGAPSDGHRGDLERFVRDGREQGVDIVVAGYLPDDELLRRSRSVGVPVVAHQHISASGSLNSWLEAGRRPIVLRSRYTQEMQDLRPGSLSLIDAAELPEAIAGALADPQATWQRHPLIATRTAHDYLQWWKESAA